MHGLRRMPVHNVEVFLKSVKKEVDNMKYNAIIFTDRQDNPVRFCCSKKNSAIIQGVFRPWYFHGRDAPFCVAVNSEEYAGGRFRSCVAVNSGEYAGGAASVRDGAGQHLHRYGRIQGGTFPSGLPGTRDETGRRWGKSPYCGQEGGADGKEVKALRV